jgi:hypothetical protein
MLSSRDLHSSVQMRILTSLELPVRHFHRCLQDPIGIALRIKQSKVLELAWDMEGVELEEKRSTSSFIDRADACQIRRQNCPLQKFNGYRREGTIYNLGDVVELLSMVSITDYV